jgi:hypothetical protein
MADEVGWTQIEHGALVNFIASSGPLRSGFEKFIAYRAQHLRNNSAMQLATVPRNVEHAVDYAAKAQELSELWETLDQALSADKQV